MSSKPALTAEEWTPRPRHIAACVTTARGNEEAELWENGELTYNDEYVVHDRHALAALCLVDQPFGFTREMGNIVRWAAEIASSMSREPRGGADPEKWKSSCQGHMVLLREVADRIEALLPPEE